MRNVLWGLVIIGFALAGGYYMLKSGQSIVGTASTPSPPARSEGKPGAKETKPELIPIRNLPPGKAFRGCPPEGDGGDPSLNRLKNREDEGAWKPVSMSWLMGLKWPKEIERKDRWNWRVRDAEIIAQHEGTPLAVEGYFVMAKASGPESCNCHGDGPDWKDYHIWMTEKPNQDRSQSLIVETTPRMRAKNPKWDLSEMNDLVRRKVKLRISGWLMMDTEHPEQLGKTRATLWEIHPVMKIEVWEGGRWKVLGK